MLGQQQGKGVARLVAWSLALLLGIFSCATHAATIQYVYDDLGRLIAEIDPVSGATQYTYDAAGNLLSVTRASSSQVSIASFTPDHGKIGDTVTILGSGFIPSPAQNTVSFAGTSATVTTATASSLVTTVPAGAVTGPITVTNTNGIATSANAFTVLALPVITGVTPSIVARATTSRVDISGSNLEFATSVAFAQAGITATILTGATNQLLPINLTVSSIVPAGAYSFSVTNEAGTNHSGAVVVLIGVEPSGEAISVTQPLSVFFPRPAQVAPSGDAMSVTQPVSVFLPGTAQVAPAGSSMSVTQPVSVSMP